MLYSDESLFQVYEYCKYMVCTKRTVYVSIYRKGSLKINIKFFWTLTFNLCWRFYPDGSGDIQDNSTTIYKNGSMRMKIMEIIRFDLHSQQISDL